MFSWLKEEAAARPDIIIIFLRSFYLLSAASILVVRCVPPLRNRFLDYGARSNTVRQRRENGRIYDAAKPLDWALDHAASWRVSHSYFLMFYVTSTLLSGFWLYDTYSIDPVLKVRSIGPIYALVLITLHSTRRLYESIFTVVPNPRSTMWIGHFAIGLAFYIFLHVAIIAEFAGTHESPFTKLTPTVLFSTVLFALASVWQHKYHEYLSSLVKYTLPERYGASSIVAPHYTAECLLYFALAILTAPSQHLFNRTLLCVLVFVIINLGVTADGTKTWQLGKFRDRRQEIERRWRMLPGIF